MKEDIMYAVVKLHPLVEEYAIPPEYVPETLWVIEYRKGNKVVGMEPYSPKKVKRLAKIMPVIYKLDIRITTSKIMYENIIRFELP